MHQVVDTYKLLSKSKEIMLSEPLVNPAFRSDELDKIYMNKYQKYILYLSRD
jgi:hypothetical protein